MKALALAFLNGLVDIGKKVVLEYLNQAKPLFDENLFCVLNRD